MNLKHFLRGPDGDGTGQGAGAGGAAAVDGAAAGAAGAVSDGAGKDGGGGASQSAAADGTGKQLSLLAQAAAGGTNAAGTAAADGKNPDGTDKAAAAGKVTRDASVPAWVPEKFKTGEELAKAYGELETRMKTSGLPPVAASEYKWTPPAGLKMDDGGTTQFREFAHGLGLTQKQYEGVMGAYVEHLGSAALDSVGFGADKAALELRKLPGWESDAGFHANLKAGSRTLSTFLSPEKAAYFETINHPAVWELLAAIGKELPEDSGLSGLTLAAGETVESLMALPAYQLALKTGQHTDESKRITEKITALNQRKLGGN